MKSSNNSELIDDILGLYCKTGLKSIENLFIRLSESQNDTYFNWLSSHRNVANTLERPDVYTSLLVLLSIRQRFEYPIKFSDLIKIFTDTKETKYLPILFTFSSLLSDENVKNLLIPFQDILQACSKFKINLPDTQGVYESLVTINQAMIKSSKPLEVTKVEREESRSVKQNTQYRKMQMFSILLQKFSNEIASAADRSGIEDFASALRSGILASPKDLSRYMPIRIEREDINEANRILKYLGKFSYRNDINANYNFIKERTMLFSGHTSREDLMKLYERREQTKDFSQYMDPLIQQGVTPEVKNQPIEEISTTDAQLLDPSFLTVLSTFFAIYHSKLSH